ncbi:hypothetical protein QBC40DRAFT_321908 [Triangularia verruculosa]|uniref:Condensation domain-containing protein n=1 Tax=Triangularia verruculosa TaxID=2587418 RepID=A0AAN6XL45_9PEZI|nr:hypothetical protein QBC40DRAFT_321908 [Triangularia verruculosa]
MATKVFSRDDIDSRTLQTIAKACRISTDHIEDVYSCVHQQLDHVSHSQPGRSEWFQIVLSFDEGIDLEQWCRALQRVVEANSVLRTRLVQCHGFGVLQAVIKEHHTTERLSGDVEAYLKDDQARRMDFGVPLLRSAFIDRNFVLTIHHAIMDYWSLTTLVQQDIVMAFLGEAPPKRPQFKQFVAHCLAIDEGAAKDFWASRFDSRRLPVVFPPVPPGHTPHPSQTVEKEMVLTHEAGVGGISPTHVPTFAEAAWALTAATYADSDSIAYGFVLSGRSPTLGGLESTLGPMHVEVPMQVNLNIQQRKGMTVEQLVKDRAISLRQLQAHPALQYGLANISRVNEAGQVSSKFQTLFNIIPTLPPKFSTAPDAPAPIRMERMLWQARTLPALILRCKLESINRDETQSPAATRISLKTLYDPEVLPERQLHRILSQFEHTLRVLTEVPVTTRLDRLPLFNKHDLSEVLQWNHDKSLLRQTKFKDTLCALFPGIPAGSCKVWLASLQNPLELAPIGSVGQLWIEGPGLSPAFSPDLSGLQQQVPTWVVFRDDLGYQRQPKGLFIRTGYLAKYIETGRDEDNELRVVGRHENRVRINNQTVQLEEVESSIMHHDDVQDVAVLTKIVTGRTQLVAIIAPRYTSEDTDSEASSDSESNFVKEVKEFGGQQLFLDSVRRRVGKCFSSERHKIPTIWFAIEQFPYVRPSGNGLHSIDREALRRWLKLRR